MRRVIVREERVTGERTKGVAGKRERESRKKSTNERVKKKIK